MAIIPKCEYCKHNEGEDQKFGFMWHCKPLGYCVPFGWHKCKANALGKGNFELDNIESLIEKSKQQKYMSKNNVTTPFQEAIQAHLDERAKNDALFERSYKNEGKNIIDCCTYILNQVRKSGCNGFTDDEVYNMAIHYYDETEIEVGSPISAHVVINKEIEPVLSKPKVKPTPKVSIASDIDDRQLSLF